MSRKSKLPAEQTLAGSQFDCGVAPLNAVANILEGAPAQRPPLAMSVTDVASALGVGRTTAIKLCASHLDTIKIGRRRLVLTASVERFLEEAARGN